MVLLTKISAENDPVPKPTTQTSNYKGRNHSLPYNAATIATSNNWMRDIIKTIG
jgi:hypothetical protein